MFETLLNFYAGVIFGTIFVLMILFFMMCMLWCRPIPRVPIAKNAPPNKIASEVEETANWISIFNNNEHFRNWFQLKIASSIQSEIEAHQDFEEFKTSGNDFNNVSFKVNKVLCSSPSFSTVKTIDTIEGTAISTFPISFTSDIKIETETIFNMSNNTAKKIKFIASISPSNPNLQITIPYEKGNIFVKFLFGQDSQISFENDIVTEETLEADGKVQEKQSKLSDQESANIEIIKNLLLQFLPQISLTIDLHTIPAEKETKDETTETDSKEAGGVGNPTNIPIPDITETTDNSFNQNNSTNQNETENKSFTEEKNENENKDENEDKNANDDDEDEDEDDGDDEEEMVGKINQMRRKFVVDQEIQQIVEQATSLINPETPANSSPITSPEKGPQ